MAYLNGIDISNWQAGINLSKLKGVDFAVFKATEYTWGVDKHCDGFYQQAKKLGILRGVYHYANGKNYKDEAEYFLKHVKGYIGDAVLVLDWEAQGNPMFGTSGEKEWVKNWLDYVYKKTGVKPMLYVQQSAMNRFKGIGDYGLWIAQYASNDPTGFQSKPWAEGTYTCAMRQYTSSGRISGYSGNLDLNKFYGDKNAWKKYAAKNGKVTDDKLASKPSTSKPAKTKLAVDGKCGPATVKAKQKLYKTTQDGKISGQPNTAKEYNYALVQGGVTEWKEPSKAEGSRMVAAEQEFLKKKGYYTGAIDGYQGPKHNTALQKYLKDKKLYTGKIDGSYGPDTCKADQKRLNKV